LWNEDFYLTEFDSKKCLRDSRHYKKIEPKSQSARLSWKPLIIMGFQTNVNQKMEPPPTKSCILLLRQGLASNFFRKSNLSRL
jgi:hypothetical protein